MTPSAESPDLSCEHLGIHLRISASELGPAIEQTTRMGGAGGRARRMELRRRQTGAKNERGAGGRARTRRQEARHAASYARLISARYSCRTYRDEPVAAAAWPTELADYLAARKVGPFGSRALFAVVAAAPDDLRALRRLGTDGFIKGATGFPSEPWRARPKTSKTTATSPSRRCCSPPVSGLGTRWLGGTFTKACLRPVWDCGPTRRCRRRGVGQMPQTTAPSASAARRRAAAGRPLLPALR